MKNTTKDIKSCPFCGGDAYIKSFGSRLYIDCNHTKTCSCRPST